MASFVYRSPLVYELVMAALYGRHYPARYRALASCIPAGAHVLELCCGPGFLYERQLRAQNVAYTGLDCNPQFIARVRRLGARGEVCDLHADQPLPPTEIVLMQASLYHFLPDAAGIVQRMHAAATERLIIAEPIRNLSTSRFAPLARLAARHTNAGFGAEASRFTEQSLDALFHTLNLAPTRSFLIPGGREKVYVFDRAACQQPAAAP